MSNTRHVNRDFFKVWGSDMAYTLGFIFADGSLETNRRGSKYLSIQICDYDLLHNIRHALGSNHKISQRKSQRYPNDLYRIQIGSKAMHADLLALGLTEQKTNTMNVPEVPEEFLGSFIRGYFDGDGNVWVGEIHKDRNKTYVAIQTAFTSASNAFLIGIMNRLKERDINGSLACRKAFSRLSYSILASLALYDLMYKEADASIYLPRKRIVFEEYINNRI